MQVDKALVYLNVLISQGWEYPDAHTKAVMKYKVDGDDLSSAYDNQ